MPGRCIVDRSTSRGDLSMSMAIREGWVTLYARKGVGDTLRKGIEKIRCREDPVSLREDPVSLRISAK